MKANQEIITDQIITLLVQRSDSGLSAKQLAELDRLKSIFPFIADIDSEITDQDFENKLISEWKAEQAIASLSRVRSKIDSIGYRRKTTKLYYKWITVAASLIMVISSLLFIYPDKQKTGKRTIEGNARNIMPADESLNITFADGKKVQISGRNAGLAIDANGVRNLNGKVITSSPTPGNITARTDRGKISRLILSDGTQVWLNAASSLKFPTAFDPKTNREVHLTGEAYFKVTHDRKHPFIVKSGNQRVMVLGTEFNISSYENEDFEKTTLYNGSVSILRGIENLVLRPGEQAKSENGSKLLITKANLEAVGSWRTDEFIFIEEPIESIMRELSRWYDIDVTFDPNVERSARFGGYISRSRPLSAILDRLEKMGNLKFEVQGRSIRVKKTTN